MHSHNHRRSFIVVALVAVALFAAGCGDDASSNEQAATQTSGASSSDQTVDGSSSGAPPFVGRVTGSDALVALVIEDGKAWAYVCDGGESGEGTVAAYLTGTVTGSELSVEGEEGVRLDATVAGDAVSGEVVLQDGTVNTFTAQKATGDAGWFSASAANGPDLELGSWIRLDDGTTRGKVLATTSGGSTGGTTQAQLGAGSIPPDAEPTGLFTCFRAKRRYLSVLVEQQNALSAGGILDEDVAAAFEDQRAACGDKAFVAT